MEKKKLKTAKGKGMEAEGVIQGRWATEWPEWPEDARKRALGWESVSRFNAAIHSAAGVKLLRILLSPDYWWNKLTYVTVPLRSNIIVIIINVKACCMICI